MRAPGGAETSDDGAPERADAEVALDEVVSDRAAARQLAPVRLDILIRPADLVRPRLGVLRRLLLLLALPVPVGRGRRRRSGRATDEHRRRRQPDASCPSRAAAAARPGALETGRGRDEPVVVWRSRPLAALAGTGAVAVHARRRACEGGRQAGAGDAGGGAERRVADGEPCLGLGPRAWRENEVGRAPEDELQGRMVEEGEVREGRW